MHILFIAQRPPYPPNKGEKIRTYNQISHLLTLGHRVTVCSHYFNEVDRADLKALAERHPVNVLDAKAPGKRAFPKALLTNTALSVANFYSRSLQQQVDKLLQEQQIDAILCTSSSMAEYVFNSSCIDQLAEPPHLLMDFMDLDSDKWRQYKEASGIPMRWIYAREASLLAKYERSVHRRFDHCIFISSEEIQLFLEKEKDLGKLITVSNGLDVDSFCLTESRDHIEQPIFLFTGVMDYFPNSDAVLWFAENVWPAIISEWPQAEFIIAGMNPSPKVSALSKQPGIEVTGFVEDIMPYYERADFFVAPFRLARGLQNKVLQAFACGLPVITTRMGNEGINGSHGTELLIADTADEYMTCIRDLVGNKTLRDSLRSKARDTVERSYSWRGQLAPLDSLLEALQTVPQRASS